MFGSSLTIIELENIGKYWKMPEIKCLCEKHQKGYEITRGRLYFSLNLSDPETAHFGRMFSGSCVHSYFIIDTRGE